MLCQYISVYLNHPETSTDSHLFYNYKRVTPTHRQSPFNQKMIPSPSSIPGKFFSRKRFIHFLIAKHLRLDPKMSDAHTFYTYCPFFSASVAREREKQRENFLFLRFCRCTIEM